MQIALLLVVKIFKKCLYSVPATEGQKRQWLHLIFNDSVLATVCVRLFVCANHLTPGCFRNTRQYKAGFASTLTLVKVSQSVPTIQDPASAPECRHILIVFTVAYEYGKVSSKLAK